MDRNRYLDLQTDYSAMSPPARVAWIETMGSGRQGRTTSVATREGGVDRNTTTTPFCKCVSQVATREGGVDRNTACDPARQYVRVVATREGGVDRNQFVGGHGADVRPSPPARVAGIEMTGLLAKALWPTVATREGGVDRNVTRAEFDALRARSPPARVAWIETYLRRLPLQGPLGRHPRGWRG